MPNVAQDVLQNKLRACLESLLDAAGLGPTIGQAVQSVFAAIDYQDPDLIRANRNEVFESLWDLFAGHAQAALRRADRLVQAVNDCWETENGFVTENADELGRILESAFDTALREMSGFQNDLIGIVKGLQDGGFEREDGYEIEIAGQLAQKIEEVQKLKQRTLSNWPWSNLPLT